MGTPYAGLAGEKSPRDARPCTGRNLSPDARIAECRAQLRSGILGLSGIDAAYNDLGVGFQQKGENGAAIQAFNHAISIVPTDVTALTNRGISYERLKRYHDAMIDFDRALTIDAKATRARKYRAYLYVALAENEAALSDFRILTSLEPQSARLYAQQGFVFSRVRRFRSAIGAYSKAVALKPKNWSYVLLRSVAEVMVHDFTSALKDTTSVATLNANLPINYYLRAEIYNFQNHPKRALANIDRAIALNPSKSDYHSLRGSLLQVAGKNIQAIADLSAAIRLGGSSPEGIYIERAYAYSEVGNYRAAFADLNHVISGDRENANALFMRGRMYFDSRKFSLAARDFQSALRLEPNRPYVVLWLHLANTRMHADDAKNFTKNVSQLKTRGWPRPILEFYLGKKSMASVFADAMGKNNPNKSDSVNNRCEAHFYTGEWMLFHNQTRAAKPQFQRAVAICPRT
ncbi:MAG: tetratricopeptide repeat protein, partial [Vulcanimicrobiaceae bacterium]